MEMDMTKIKKKMVSVEIPQEEGVVIKKIYWSDGSWTDGKGQRHYPKPKSEDGGTKTGPKTDPPKKPKEYLSPDAGT